VLGAAVGTALSNMGGIFAELKEQPMVKMLGVIDDKDMIDIDKKVALNAQATELNRQYDALARDAGFKLLEQKLDCCCEKAAMKMDWLAEKECMNNASLLSYVNSNFIPGTLKLPANSICPTVQLA
jgi:hypothetical protein